MKPRHALFAVLLFLLSATPVAFAAATSVGLEIARGDSDSMAYSLKVAQKYAPWFSSSLFEIGPSAEIGGHAWVDNKSHVDTVWGAFVAPGLYFTLFTDSSIRPFVSGSLGGAINSKDHLDERNLGSNALFRTRGSVGLSFGEEYRHTVQGNYTNYSTWGLTNKNDGYSTYGLSYSYSF